MKKTSFFLVVGLILSCVLLLGGVYATQWHFEERPIGLIAYKVFPPERVYLFRVASGLLSIEDGRMFVVEYDFGVVSDPDQPMGTCTAFSVPETGEWDPQWRENPLPKIQYPEAVYYILLSSGIFDDPKMQCEVVVFDNFEISPNNIRAIQTHG